jgi:hypothetical protein
MASARFPWVQRGVARLPQRRPLCVSASVVSTYYGARAQDFKVTLLGTGNPGAQPAGRCVARPEQTLSLRLEGRVYRAKAMIRTPPQKLGRSCSTDRHLAWPTLLGRRRRRTSGLTSPKAGKHQCFQNVGGTIFGDLAQFERPPKINHTGT